MTTESAHDRAHRLVSIQGRCVVLTIGHLTLHTPQAQDELCAEHDACDLINLLARVFEAVRKEE